jgi:catechol 2,3-dioxygenase-like lactoylglutathione lyase family enzyme
MSRVQLALNVSDLDATVEFYTKLFATEPAKLRPAFANFAVAEPSAAACCAARPDLATHAPTPS